MHDRQTIVTDDRGICPSVSQSRGSTRFHCAKTAKRIKILFGVNTVRGPVTIMLGYRVGAILRLHDDEFNLKFIVAFQNVIVLHHFV